MKNPCPVCMEHPVVYAAATTCSYHCWTISIQKETTSMDQTTMEYAGEATSTPKASKTSRRPRVTAKDKKAFLADVYAQIHNGWNPTDESYKVIDSISAEVHEAEKK